MRVEPWLLWSRAFVLGLLATGLGIAGHTSADGLLPGAGTLTALGFVMVALSSLLLLRPASGVRLALAQAAGQAFVHAVLTSSAGHGGTTMVQGHVPHMQAEAHASVLPAGHVVTHMTAHAPMALAHLVVAALVGWWLARGESALWTLIALASRRLVITTPALAVVDPLPHQLTTPAPCPAGPRSPWQAHARTRRGPPLAFIC